MTRMPLLLGFATLAAASPTIAAPAELLAGAGRADITPPASALQHGDRIRDPLNVRAIVVRDGRDCAVLVGIDQGAVRDQVARPAAARAARASGCAIDNVLISATHTHSGSTAELGEPGEPNGARVEDAIVAAVTQAAGAMRPARMRYATTPVHLNMNRDLFAGRWVQGPNPAGHSDKTLAVLAFLDAAGTPIGVYMNYAMHPVNFYLSGLISADFPGEASRYVERQYGGATVAIFAQGASGDQNPALQRPQRRLIRVRTHDARAGQDALTAPPPWAVTAGQRNAVTAASARMATPIAPAERAAYETAVANTGEIVAATGAIIGEAAIQALADQPALTDRAVIRGASSQFQCPGRDRTDRDDPVREGALPPYRDGVPVTIRTGVLRIGDAYLAWVNGEVYSDIASHLKASAPVVRLMMTTLANGAANSGYIYSNEAGDRLTFQVIGSRLKPGCADDAIVSADVALIGRLAR